MELSDSVFFLCDHKIKSEVRNRQLPAPLIVPIQLKFKSIYALEHSLLIDIIIKSCCGDGFS